ncbi:MAG: metalloregulator ArsR/SmtB family transcription factor [Gemmatimonadales bacterium]
MREENLVRSLESGALARAADVIRLLGHPDRLKIVEVLEGGEATVSDIMAQLDLAQPVVSQQLARMRSCDIVAARREGVYVYYRITEPKVAHVLNCIRTCDTRTNNHAEVDTI